MTAKLVYGQPLAEGIYQNLAPWIHMLTHNMGRAPSLHVVLIGENPASLVYVNRKQKQCHELGITSHVHRLSPSIPFDEVTQLINQLNHQAHVDGILLQMPLPTHLNSADALNLIDHNKDVDGLTATSLGVLYMGQQGIRPCTPLGVMYMLKHIWGNLAGKHIVVKGRSLLVGRSLATMLTHANATVTLMHSHSQKARDITQLADGVVMAVGRPNSLTGDDIRKGAVVIDVGINRMEDGSLAGDVDAASVSQVAGYLTPVPGGVGPMTIAGLMANTVYLAYQRLLQQQKGKLYDELALFERTHPFPIGNPM